MARPTTYSIELAAFICDQIADGASLRSVSRENADMPAQSTIFSWLSQHNEFAEQYARACEARADALVEESFEIADDARNDWMEKHGRDGQSLGYFINGEAVQRSKLRIEHRRWAAERLKPKVYGNRQYVEHSGSIALVGIDDDELVATIMELVTTGRFKPPGGVQLFEGEPAVDDDDFSDLVAARDDDPHGVG